MQKILLSAILALFMALALVGLKHVVGAGSTASGTILMAACGSAPTPPPAPGN
jgi:hypothetical protein